MVRSYIRCRGRVRFHEAKDIARGFRGVRRRAVQRPISWEGALAVHGRPTPARCANRRWCTAPSSQTISYKDIEAQDPQTTAADRKGRLWRMTANGEPALAPAADQLVEGFLGEVV